MMWLLDYHTGFLWVLTLVDALASQSVLPFPISGRSLSALLPKIIVLVHATSLAGPSSVSGAVAGFSALQGHGR